MENLSSTPFALAKELVLLAASKLLPTAGEKSPRWLAWSIPSLLLGYPILVSLLRYRRLRSMHKKYKYDTRESFAEMTDYEAWEIQRTLLWLEFPFVYTKSLQFALFKTYGIPTISSLLVQTSEFTTPDTTPKRYTDTSILIAEFVGHPPSDPRSLDAISRMNYLHSGYRKAGKILDRDMLYTLSLFALEPIRYIEKYEWRGLSELEKCAIGTYWKSMGDAMGVSFEELPSSSSGGGFRDGLHWLEEVGDWSERYEAEKMVAAESSRVTADETAAVLLWMVPGFLKPLGLGFVSYMMDDRLRKAMMYEPPSLASSTLFTAIFSARKLLLRHLSLPRPYIFRNRVLSDDPHADGRFPLRIWNAAPYYVQPTLLNRWGPTAWLTRLMGRPLPGDEGEKYYPGGYVIGDMGPRRYEGKGAAEVKRTREWLERERTGGCPFG